MREMVCHPQSLLQGRWMSLGEKQLAKRWLASGFLWRSWPRVASGRDSPSARIPTHAALKMIANHAFTLHPCKVWEFMLSCHMPLGIFRKIWILMSQERQLL